MTGPDLEGSGAPLELLTVGRIGVDLYAEEVGASFTDARHFQKSVGGSPTNVAVAAARLGHRAAVLTRVGDDDLGRYVIHALEHEFGVDTSFVGVDPVLPTPVVIAALDPPEDPRFVFYREPAAPDAQILAGDVDPELVRTLPIVWLSASALAAEPSRTTVQELLRTRERREHTILDLDYRPSFWAGEDVARATIGAAVAGATVAVGNRVECEIAVGTSVPDEAADRLLEQGISLAVVKLGAEGVLAATPGGRERVAALPVEVVCGLGAGDAFGGALCHGLLRGWSPADCVRFANAAGALVASRLLCADAMPTVPEVEELLEGVHA